MTKTERARKRRGASAARLRALVLVVVLIGACQPPGPYEGTGKRVAVFGDSITWGAVADGRRAVEGKNLAVSWNAAPFLSTHHFQGHFVYQSYDPADLVVVATGTNDAGDGAVDGRDVDAIRAAMHSMRNVACVLWVNTRSEISSNHAQWNGLLARELGPLWNTRILDWDRYSDDQAAWVQPDNVHLTPAGSVAYAAWLADEMVRGCNDTLVSLRGGIGGQAGP